MLIFASGGCSRGLLQASDSIENGVIQNMFKQFPFGDSGSPALLADLTGGAKSTNWAGVSNVNGFLNLLLFIGAGTAAQDITITLAQATSNAGAGSKLLQVKEVYFKAGAAGAILAAKDFWTKSSAASREAPANSYASATDRVAATNQFMALIRISPADLDVAGGYGYVGASFNSPAASQLACGLWVPEQVAYKGSDWSPLS